MKTLHDRRTFLKMAATGMGAGLAGNLLASGNAESGKRIGIIGLDTSHSIAFTKALNPATADPVFEGYKVVAAYPYGSRDIESSTKRIPGYIEEIKKLGVEIAESIDALLRKTDVILLETNDGRLHLEQALPVLKAGKRMFIDKPIAASLKDAIAMMDAAKKYNVPVFSASSLRYIKGVKDIAPEQVTGADTFSPATLEKTHPDLFWYGIHGVEALFTAMGRGCREVVRVHNESTDIVIGTWEDGRIGTFRGIRSGKKDYGGTVYGQNANVTLGPYAGYEPLLRDIIRYFKTGEMPVTPEETLEIIAFMEAADESKRQQGAPVTLKSVFEKAGRP